MPGREGPKAEDHEAPYENPDNPLLAPDWSRIGREMALSYEGEMRAALASGNLEVARLYRDLADIEWDLAQTGAPRW